MKHVSEHSLFTATHSFISTYFGSATIVLKEPFTRAALTKLRLSRIRLRLGEEREKLTADRGIAVWYWQQYNFRSRDVLGRQRENEVESSHY